MTMTLTETLLHQLHHCINLLHRNNHRGRHGGGMHHRGQGRILSLLNNNDGISQKDLMDMFRIRPASLSELLDKLEHNGLVERRQSEQDRRSSNVFLTEDGRKIAIESEKHRKEMADNLFSEFSQEEQKQLSSLLTKLTETLDTFAGEEDNHHHKCCRHSHEEKENHEHHGHCHRDHHDRRHHRHDHCCRHQQESVHPDE